MGLLDRLGRKSSKWVRTRRMGLEYEFTCVACGSVQTVPIELDIVEDERSTYAMLMSRSGESVPVKIASAKMGFDERSGYDLHDLYDSHGKELIPLSRERMRESALHITCGNCKGLYRQLLAQAFISDQQGNILLVGDKKVPGVSSLPIVLLEHDTRTDSITPWFLEEIA